MNNVLIDTSMYNGRFMAIKPHLLLNDNSLFVKDPLSFFHISVPNNFIKASFRERISIEVSIT